MTASRRRLNRLAKFHTLKGMTAGEISRLMTVEQYLDAEQASPVRREYVGGYVYVRVETRTVHNRIATSLLGTRYAQLKGSSGTLLASETRMGQALHPSPSRGGERKRIIGAAKLGLRPQRLREAKQLDRLQINRHQVEPRRA